MPPSFYVAFGFISMLAFSSRFLLQWIQSELKQKSYITPIFWILSLCGNIALSTHYLIQMQYHLYVIQALSAVISYRQLVLMRRNPTGSMKQTILLLATTALGATTIFALRSFIEYHAISWIHMPQFPWQKHELLPIAKPWHMLGFFGTLLFASRFWIQWWFSEKAMRSFLGPAFWWISLSGAILALIYALHIRDVITAIGSVTGIIPYLRNLMLLRKTSKKSAI